MSGHSATTGSSSSGSTSASEPHCAKNWESSRESGKHRSRVSPFALATNSEWVPPGPLRRKASRTPGSRNSTRRQSLRLQWRHRCWTTRRLKRAHSLCKRLLFPRRHRCHEVARGSRLYVLCQRLLLTHELLWRLVQEFFLEECDPLANVREGREPRWNPTKNKPKEMRTTPVGRPSKMPRSSPQTLPAAYCRRTSASETPR